jgi:hypothetical protein
MKRLISSENLIRWNRKLHIYAGLFLLFFILLFSFSGLLLNHGQWKFASFWQERKESEKVIRIAIPSPRDSSALIGYLMKELNITGEISEVRSNPESLSFRVARPGLIRNITADLKTGGCIIKEMEFNWWGKIRSLHTFNGSDKAHPEVKPNWSVTRLWRLTMDIVAIGLIFLCQSSWIMWSKVRKNYPAGFIFLIMGIIGAFVFIFLIR